MPAALPARACDIDEKEFIGSSSNFTEEIAPVRSDFFLVYHIQRQQFHLMTCYH
jgi:hypothetical protein